MRTLIAFTLAILCAGRSIQAQVYIFPVPGGDPDRVIRLDIEKAIRRALTLPSRVASPPPQPAAPPPPVASPPPGQETREQWRQRLFDEMRGYCTQYPDDSACGPNALGGGPAR